MSGQLCAMPFWMWRNTEKHDENYMRPSEPICHILQRRKDYEQAKKFTIQVIRIEVRVRNIEWKPPLDNMVKLNTDGRNKDNNTTGCGGVIRDAGENGLVASPNIWEIIVP